MAKPSRAEAERASLCRLPRIRANATVRRSPLDGPRRILAGRLRGSPNAVEQQPTTGDKETAARRSASKWIHSPRVKGTHGPPPATGADDGPPSRPPYDKNPKKM